MGGGLLCRSFSEHPRAPSVQTTPLPAAVDDHPPLAQNVGKELGGLLDVLTQDEVHRLADLPIEAPLQTNHRPEVGTRVVDHQVYIRVGPILAGRGRPEENGQSDAGLRAQRLPQPAENLPVSPQIQVFAGGQPYLLAPESLPAERAVVDVSTQGSLTAGK